MCESLLLQYTKSVETFNRVYLEVIYCYICEMCTQCAVCCNAYFDMISDLYSALAQFYNGSKMIPQY